MKPLQNLKVYINNLPKRLLDKEQYQRIVSCYTYTVMMVIAVVMSIINCFTNVGFLLVATSVLALLCALNLILALHSKEGVRASGVMFAFEILICFSYFIISGNPEGFSIIWLTLLPPISMLFYGKRGGTFLSVAMFVILVFFLRTPAGNELLFNPAVYNETFKLRFPVLYLGCTALAFLLSTIQENAMNAIEKMNKQNEENAAHDQLTGLLNRNGLIKEVETLKRYQTAKKVGFILLDIDNFKSINDTYGHITGDKVLKRFGSIIQSHLNGIVSRWGGDEFFVAFYDDDITPEDLENFRHDVETTIFRYGDGVTFNITASVGVFVTGSKSFNDLRDWMKHADEALYQSKKSGRNRVTYYHNIGNTNKIQITIEAKQSKGCDAKL